MEHVQKKGTISVHPAQNDPITVNQKREKTAEFVHIIMSKKKNKVQ